jgi:hypothetical protein
MNAKSPTVRPRRRQTNFEFPIDRGGHSLLEVLVVIGLTSLLLQLLLPGLNAAREAARRRQCATHLRQLGLAALLHHDTFGHLPSGGWHYTWIGEPERGTGPEQPGGWAFNLLGFLEQSELRTAGRHQSQHDRSVALANRCATTLPLFHCPSRREARPYPQTWNRQPYTSDGQLSEPLEWVAKSDYAASAGSGAAVEFAPQWTGPTTLAEGDRADFAWPDLTPFDGVIFGRSRIRFRQVRDGLSRTYLIGEKYVDPLLYTTGEDWGDNENLYTGFNNDHSRSALSPPRRDRGGDDYRNSFGSAHVSVWQVVRCDGSVQALDYDIDTELHRRQAARADSDAGPVAWQATSRTRPAQ